MAVSLIPVLIVLAAALLLVIGVVAITRRQDARVEEVERPTTPTLRYQVPEGQDPTAVMVALRDEGYDAVSETEFVVVTVPVDSREERERVREIIGRAGINIENPTPPATKVRFEDE